MEDLAQVALYGFLLLAFLLLGTRYEAALEAVAAIAFIAAVIAGFMLHPRKDVYYVRTKIRARDRRGQLTKERDVVAVRVELVRLWLLFILTMPAVGLLVFAAARGKFWEFSALNRIFAGTGETALFQAMLFAPFSVSLLLWIWINERWVMRDAEACSAREYKIDGRAITYQFLGEHGEYYAGWGSFNGLNRAPELRSIVFYSPRKWRHNRIAMGLMFHRIVVLGHGVTELDAQTANKHAVLAAEPALNTAQVAMKAECRRIALNSVDVRAT
jgi:hypothetical protein